MKNILLSILILLFFLSCEKNKKPTENEFEKQYTALKGEWVSIQRNYKFSSFFKDNNELIFYWEIPGLPKIQDTMYYSIFSEDSINIKDSDGEYDIQYKIDSNNYLHWYDSIGTEVRVLKRTVDCDDACERALKNEIVGEWKITGNFSYLYSDILLFSNDGILKMVNSSRGDTSIFIYSLFPEDYMSKIKIKSIEGVFNNYSISNDTLFKEVYIQSMIPEEASYTDTIIYIKQSD